MNLLNKNLPESEFINNLHISRILLLYSGSLLAFSSSYLVFSNFNELTHLNSLSPVIVLL